MAVAQSLRWEPLTAFFLVASAWWVKWPLIAVVGGCGDLWKGRRLPAAALTALMAAGVAGLAVSGLKGLADRARPPFADSAIAAVGAIPDSSSFPSGHSATAFATAVAVGMLYPRLRIPLLTLAALVALSRVYLGVHYWSDVVAGSLLGVAIGLATVWLTRLGPRVPTALARRRGLAGTSSTLLRRSPARAPSRP
jgi:membrane-associated phospholipid phosphatase